MMDGATIRDLQLKATLRAAKRNSQPFVVWPGDKAKLKAGAVGYKALPFLGNYVPHGWIMEEDLLFVDSSGFGRKGEPALTIDEFIDKLEEGKGYAIVEAGEFQVYIGVYTKEVIQ